MACHSAFYMLIHVLILVGTNKMRILKLGEYIVTHKIQANEMTISTLRKSDTDFNPTKPEAMLNLALKIPWSPLWRSGWADKWLKTDCHPADCKSQISCLFEQLLKPAVSQPICFHRGSSKFLECTVLFVFLTSLKNVVQGLFSLFFKIISLRISS